GVLSFDPEKGLDLTVKALQERDSDGAWHRYFMDKINNADRMPSVIHGKDEHNHPVTLFGCGSWERSATSGLDTYRLTNIDSAILNFHGHSLDEAKFPVVHVSYTLLNAWMNREVFKMGAMEGDL